MADAAKRTPVALPSGGARGLGALAEITQEGAHHLGHQILTAGGLTYITGAVIYNLLTKQAQPAEAAV